MTPDDIETLWRFKGGHVMARLASRPESEIPHQIQSMHGSYSWPTQIDTKRDGVHVTDRESGDHRVITWTAMRAHIRAHATDEIRGWIDAMDWEWCRASTSTPGFPPARAATCKRWLDSLARTAWDPDLVRTEPEQLTIFDALEAMT